MTLQTAYRLSAVALAICLLALASDLAIYLLHIRVAPKFKQVLDVVAFVWPLAMVFFGTYQRKIHAAAQVRSPPQ